MTGSTIRHSNIKKSALKRKNFLPTLIVTILLWLILAGLIYFVDPGVTGTVPLFFVILFAALLFTFSLIFASSRRGLIISSSSSLFLILAYLGVGNIINLLLIVAIAICIELYFKTR